MKASMQKLLDDLNKRYTPPGAEKNVLVPYNEFDPVEMVPTSSYALSYLLGGGWRVGKLHEFFGPEHGGKTTLTFLALKDMFDHYQGRKAVIYCDIEHRFNPEWAEIMGLRRGDNLIVMQPSNAEAATDMLHEMLMSQEFCAYAWDSVGASASTDEQKTFTDKQYGYGGVANVMTRHVKTIAPIANLFNATGFYTNQLRADMSGYNRPMTPGGHALKHEMSMRIYLRRGKDKYSEKTAEGDVQVGYPMVFKTVKNTYGPTPREQWSDFYFQPSRWLDHVGFDHQKDLQRLGILTGVFEQSSSWYYYKKDSPEEIKGNGRDAFFKALADANKEQEVADAVLKTLAASGSNEVEYVALDKDLARPETEGPEIDDPEV